MKTASDADLLTELTTDPAGLGYRNADGSWKSASQIGHLLSVGTPCRASALWDGGVVDLKRIAKIVYGGEWLETMLAAGELNLQREHTPPHPQSDHPKDHVVVLWIDKARRYKAVGKTENEADKDATAALIGGEK